MPKDFELETLYEIWSNQDGSSIEVGPDRDGLDLVEIRQRDEGHKIIARITMAKEQAELLKVALGRMTD